MPPINRIGERNVGHSGSRRKSRRDWILGMAPTTGRTRKSEKVTFHRRIVSNMQRYAFALSSANRVYKLRNGRGIIGRNTACLLERADTVSKNSAFLLPVIVTLPLSMAINTRWFKRAPLGNIYLYAAIIARYGPWQRHRSN